MLGDGAIDIGTLYHMIDGHEAQDPNAVKLVVAENGDAYILAVFAIPYNRDEDLALAIASTSAFTRIDVTCCGLFGFAGSASGVCKRN